MRRQRRWVWAVAAGLGLASAAGCQTWVPEAAMTLPSGHYLKHQPQYISPSPPFPLTRELATLEEATARQVLPAPGFPEGPLP